MQRAVRATSDCKHHAFQALVWKADVFCVFFGHFFYFITLSRESSEDVNSSCAVGLNLSWYSVHNFGQLFFPSQKEAWVVWMSSGAETSSTASRDDVQITKPKMQRIKKTEVLWQQKTRIYGARKCTCTNVPQYVHVYNANSRKRNPISRLHGLKIPGVRCFNEHKFCWEAYPGLILSCSFLQPNPAAWLARWPEAFGCARALFWKQTGRQQFYVRKRRIVIQHRKRRVWVLSCIPDVTDEERARVSLKFFVWKLAHF